MKSLWDYSDVNSKHWSIILWVLYISFIFPEWGGKSLQMSLFNGHIFPLCYIQLQIKDNEDILSKSCCCCHQTLVLKSASYSCSFYFFKNFMLFWRIFMRLIENNKRVYSIFISIVSIIKLNFLKKIKLVFALLRIILKHWGLNHGQFKTSSTTCQCTILWCHNLVFQKMEFSAQLFFTELFM